MHSLRVGIVFFVVFNLVAYAPPAPVARGAEGPLAAFTAVGRIGPGPRAVEFTNLSTGAITYTWDYGDGTTSNDNAPSHVHTYAVPGTYPVSLTATDGVSTSTIAKSSYVAVFEESTPDTYYVDAEAGSDLTGDGSDLAPWRTITHALGQMAGVGLELRIASGVYNQALGEVFPINMKSGISLAGVDRTAVVIQGNGTANLLRFSAVSSFTTATAVRGLKLTGGQSAVFIDGSGNPGTGPLIEDNWLTGNSFGVWVQIWSGGLVTAEIRANLISGNTSGGINNDVQWNPGRSAIVIDQNEITGNTGDGIICYAAHGAAHYGKTVCSPTITRNDIHHNTGDGIDCRTSYEGYCDPVITGNTIHHNGAWGYSRDMGGCICDTSTQVFINNLIVRNVGGGLKLQTGSPDVPNGSHDIAHLLHNTIAYNGLYGVIGSTPLITNTVIWGHTNDTTAAVANVAFSDISQGPYAGVNGNVSLNPRFVSSATDNFHLQALSPLIDSALSTAWALPAVDAYGAPRVVDTLPDIGAVEMQTPPLLMTITDTSGGRAGYGLPMTNTVTVTNTSAVTRTFWITTTAASGLAPSQTLFPEIELAPGQTWSSDWITAPSNLSYRGALSETVLLTSTQGDRRVQFHGANQLDRPIQGLEITLNTPVAQSQTLIATAVATQGDNMLYDWWLSSLPGDPTSGATNRHGISSSWSSMPTGTHYVTLRASNGFGTTVISRTVTVDQAATDVMIAGLTATQDGPVRVGGPVHLSASITQGTNVSYAWLVDGQYSAVGPTAEFTLMTPGTYAATVTVSNAVSVGATTVYFTVLPEPITFSLSAPISEYWAAPGTVLTYTTTATASGPGIATFVVTGDAFGETLTPTPTLLSDVQSGDAYVLAVTAVVPETATPGDTLHGMIAVYDQEWQVITYSSEFIVHVVAPGPSTNRLYLPFVCREPYDLPFRVNRPR